ncbi:unnamed protein product [Urochloa humidicola]
MAAPPPWVLLCRAVRAEHDAAADFTLPVAEPPGVTVLAAGSSAHPDPNLSDRPPFIIAAAPGCLLASFAVAPLNGQYFGDNPLDAHLVVVRDFRRAVEGPMEASAEHLPNRVGIVPNLSNFQSVGLVPDIGVGYTIVELQVHKGGDRATIVTFDSVHRAWFEEDVDSPLAEEERDREWVPHGVVVLENTLWWFDLS